MFNIDSKYLVDKTFKPTDFVAKDLSRNDKKKLKDTIKSANLKYQIKGEEIPSLINDLYNYQVIMFFEIELNSLKSANYVNNILQKEVIKAPCVFKFYDNISCCYAFADKRLTLQEGESIVIDNTVITNVQSKNAKLDERLDYKNILNKQNKRNFYTELMIKSYVLSNIKLVQGLTTIFDTNIWYDETKKMNLFGLLKELQTLKQQQTKTVIAREKIELNTKMKDIIQGIQKYCEVSQIV